MPVANIKDEIDGNVLDDGIVTALTIDPFYRYINPLSDISDSMVNELASLRIISEDRG